MTMVVPHSICFAKQKQQLRDVCNKRAQSTHLRTYNNRPSSVFPPHPFIKGGNRASQNRQRVTILSVLVKHEASERNYDIRASCYIGLRDDLRKQILRYRPMYRQPYSKQWTMAGSEVLSRLLEAMHAPDQIGKIASETREISFPPTAYYFLTCLPREVLDSARRRKYRISDDEYFWPSICLFNSTVFHAFWLMVGDAFDVLPSLFDSVRLPPAWISDTSLRSDAAAIGREFCSENVLSRSRTEFVQHGKKFPNFNFQDNAPDLVKKADQVCIKGYRLENYEVELLDQIQRLRQFRTWDM